MASEAIASWLKTKRRNEIASSAALSVVALAGGAVLFLLTSGLILVAVEIIVLRAIPVLALAWVLSTLITAVIGGLIVLDSVRYSREDMSIVPFWLAREFLHFGTRVMVEGFRQAGRVVRLKGIDVDRCAEVLGYLAGKKAAVTREELSREFPALAWPELISELREFDGVIVLGQDKSRVTLTAILRLELRGLLTQEQPANAPEENAPPVSVEEPERFSPFEILGVSPAASLTEIKAAYRGRVKECHPDRFSGMDEQSLRLAEEWTKALNAAYETLTLQHAGTKTRN